MVSGMGFDEDLLVQSPWFFLRGRSEKALLLVEKVAYSRGLDFGCFGGDLSVIQ